VNRLISAHNILTLANLQGMFQVSNIWTSAVSSPSWVWGGASAKIEFDAF